MVATDYRILGWAGRSAEAEPAPSALNEPFAGEAHRRHACAIQTLLRPTIDMGSAFGAVRAIGRKCSETRQPAPRPRVERHGRVEWCQAAKPNNKIAANRLSTKGHRIVGAPAEKLRPT